MKALLCTALLATASVDVGVIGQEMQGYDRANRTRVDHWAHWVQRFEPLTIGQPDSFASPITSDVLEVAIMMAGAGQRFESDASLVNSWLHHVVKPLREEGAVVRVVICVDRSYRAAQRNAWIEVERLNAFLEGNLTLSPTPRRRANPSYDGLVG